MDQHMLQTEIDQLAGKLKEQTEQYFEAITRRKDFTAARNIKLKINSLNKNLSSRMQMMGGSPEIR
jgi:hypothetical protein